MKKHNSNDEVNRLDEFPEKISVSWEAETDDGSIPLEISVKELQHAGNKMYKFFDGISEKLDKTGAVIQLTDRIICRVQFVPAEEDNEGNVESVEEYEFDFRITNQPDKNTRTTSVSLLKMDVPAQFIENGNKTDMIQSQFLMKYNNNATALIREVRVGKHF